MITTILIVIAAVIFFLERLRVSPGMVNYFDVYSCHKYKPTERIRLVQKKRPRLRSLFVCMNIIHRILFEILV